MSEDKTTDEQVASKEGPGQKEGNGLGLMGKLALTTAAVGGFAGFAKHELGEYDPLTDTWYHANREHVTCADDRVRSPEQKDLSSAVERLNAQHADNANSSGKGPAK